MIIKKIFRPINFVKRFKLALNNPLKWQKKILFKILKQNQNTEYGKKYNFSEINSIEDFQKLIPIITYPDIKSQIDRLKHGEQNILIKDKVLFFATSSGTTSEPKFIPVTKKRMDFHRGEFLLWLNYMFKSHKRILNGKTLYWGAGHLNGYTEAKIPHGNISGYLVYNSSKFVKSKLVIDSDILNMQDFDKKMEKIAIKSLLEKNIVQIAFASAVQAILFFDYLIDHKDRLIDLVKGKDKERAKELGFLKEFKPGFIWPKLWLINCLKSGFNMSYLEVVREKIGKNVTIRDPGIMASEGRISLGITDIDRAGIIPVNECFFEFMEERGNNFLDPVTLDKLELGKKYKVLLTTFEGLYRYDLEDILEVVSFEKRVPVVKFVSRNKFLNVTEEHAPEREIILGVENAMKKFGIKYRGFTVLPNVSGRKPKYEILFEPLNEFEEHLASDLIKEIDKNWQDSILTYAETRNEFGRMENPVLSLVEKGNYDNVEAKVLVLRAQAKPVLVTEDINYKKKFNVLKIFD